MSTDDDVPEGKKMEARALVVGGGPAGLTTALALSAAGASVTLAAPPTAAASADGVRDPRTTALFGDSITLLENLGIWPRISSRVAPLVGLRLVDDTGGLFRAPEILFEAGEIGRETFGYNIENDVLNAALSAAIEETQGIDVIAEMIDGLDLAPDRVAARSAASTVWTGALVAAADGRNSLCRREAGISATPHPYAQHAIVCKFAHSRGHADVSTELHRRSGPLTTVPLPGQSSSLVWVETPDEAARLKALPDAAFAAELSGHLDGLLGRIEALTPRFTYPLSRMTADPLAQRRVALVGEAAHVIPPIGAQGLNLGFRDAAWLADAVETAIRAGRDLGDPITLAAYTASRKPDIRSRTAIIDILNRSLLADAAPLDLARAAGLGALQAIGPLRRLAMREGMGPNGPLPRLMRSSAIEKMAN